MTDELSVLLATGFPCKTAGHALAVNDAAQLKLDANLTTVTLCHAADPE